MARKRKRKRDKNPKLGVPEPGGTKSPKVAPALAIDSDLQKPTWRFGKVDRDWSECGWNLADSAAYEDVVDRLRSLESMTWKQVKDETGSHYVQLDEIEAFARRRLEELKLDDLDQLYSIRVTGRKRVWGIRSENSLQVLWWDPMHRICPSEKKNT